MFSFSNNWFVTVKFGVDRPEIQSFQNFNDGFVDFLTEKLFERCRTIRFEWFPFDNIRQWIGRSFIDRPIDIDQCCTITQTHRIKSDLSRWIDELIFRIARTHRRNDATKIEERVDEWKHNSLFTPRRLIVVLYLELWLQDNLLLDEIYFDDSSCWREIGTSDLMLMNSRESLRMNSTDHIAKWNRFSIDW